MICHCHVLIPAQLDLASAAHCSETRSAGAGGLSNQTGAVLVDSDKLTGRDVALDAKQYNVFDFYDPESVFSKITMTTVRAFLGWRSNCA